MARRRRKNRKFLKVILAIIVVVLATIILCRITQRVALSCSYFDIKSVSVKSERDKDVIYNFAKQELLGKNIFQADLDSLSKKIAKKFPNISRVVLIRKFPNRVEINITLRKPLAKVLFPSRKTYYLDQDGALFPEIELTKHFDSLPVVEGIKENPSHKQLREISSLLKSIENIDFGRNLVLTQIIIDNRGELVFYVDRGFYVKIGSRDFIKRLDTLKLLFDETSFDFAKLKYIDVRFKEPSLVYN